MSVISLPVGLLITRQTMGQKRNDLQFTSAAGSSQTRVLSPPRWLCGLVSPDSMPLAAAAQWRGLVLAARGMINQIEVYDIINPQPRGTYRGTLKVASAIAIGDTTLALKGGNAGGTLLTGDWIGVGADASRQLFQVAADAAANGSGDISITVEPPARYASAVDVACTWFRPTCLMRQTGTSSSWEGRPGSLQGGFSLDLMESWE